MTTSESVRPESATAGIDTAKAGNGGPTLRVRQDLLFSESLDGVLLRWGSTGFVLKGGSAYGWVSALLPFLDGTRTMEEIVGGLGEGQARTARQVLESLIARGAVRTGRAPSDASLLAAPDRAAFAEQLAYVAHYTDDGDEALARVRATSVDVVGTGSVAEAVLLGLLANGFGSVGCEPAHLESSAVRRELDALRTRRVETHLGPVTHGADVTVVADPELTYASTVSLVGSVVSRGGVALPVTWTPRRALAGPLQRQGGVLTLDDAVRRYAAVAERDEAHAYWRARALDRALPVHPSDLAGALLGNLLAFEVFKHVSRARPAETDEGVVVFDFATLVGGAERPLPLPTGVAPLPTRSDAVAEREEQPRSWMQGAETGLEAFTGTSTGLLPDYDDLLVQQSPVKIGRVRLALPDADGGPVSTAGWSCESLAEARGHAAHAALALYCDELGPGLVQQLSPDDADRLPRAEGLCVERSAVLRRDGDVRWLAATDLHSGATVAVDRALAFPAAAATKRDVPVTRVGLGAARTADDATWSGLASALSHRALVCWSEGEGSTWRLDLNGRDSRRTAFLRRSLAIVDVAVEAYVLEHAPGLVTVGVVGTRLDAGPRVDRVAVATGTSVDGPLDDALAELLAHVQSADDTADGGRTLHTAFDPGFTISGDALRWVTETRPDPDPLAHDDLHCALEALAAGGMRAYRIPLTASDVAAVSDVCVVKVLVQEPLVHATEPSDR